MNKFVLFLLIVVLITACKSYSLYPINNKPTTKIDTSLLGIWKAVEDTDKANFVLVQCPEDLAKRIKRWNELSEKEKLATLDSSQLKNPIILESVSSSNKSKDDRQIQNYIAQKEHYYSISYFNMHGTNPLYQQWESFLSEVNKVLYINIPYRYIPGFDDDKPKTNPKEEGFFFVRIISVSPKSLVTAVVADPTLKDLKSSAAVRERIAKNINNPRFYSDTLHFYKVSDYHESLNEAVKRANP